MPFTRREYAIAAAVCKSMGLWAAFDTIRVNKLNAVPFRQTSAPPRQEYRMPGEPWRPSDGSLDGP